MALTVLGLSPVASARILKNGGSPFNESRGGVTPPLLQKAEYSKKYKTFLFYLLGICLGRMIFNL
jgi:hypothetical protein